MASSSSSSSSERTPLSLMDVCTQPDCQAKKGLACPKTHECGHYCCGTRFDADTSCLECIHASCAPPGANQTGDDYCNICWTDDLYSAPCIKLDCGHIFHYLCVIDKLRARWPGTRTLVALPILVIGTDSMGGSYGLLLRHRWTDQLRLLELPLV